MSEKTGGAPPGVERRSQTVVGKILRAERAIELEIQRNGGAYPRNGGELSVTEVCRRAGITAKALQAKPLTSAVRVQLEAWLQRTTGEAPAPAEARSIGEVVNGGEQRKTQLEQIADSYHLASLEVANLRKRVKALEERRNAMAEKFENLNAALNGKTGRRSPSH